MEEREEINMAANVETKKENKYRKCAKHKLNGD